MAAEKKFSDIFKEAESEPGNHVFSIKRMASQLGISAETLSKWQIEMPKVYEHIIDGYMAKALLIEAIEIAKKSGSDIHVLRAKSKLKDMLQFKDIDVFPKEIPESKLMLLQ